MSTTRKDIRQRIGGVEFCGDMLGDSAYEEHQIWSILDKNNAINAAVLASGMRFPRVIQNTSLTLTASTYTYALANLTVAVDRFWGIDKIEYDSGSTETGYPYIELPREEWGILDNNATLTLQLLDLPTTGETIRLTYRARPAVFTADSSTGGVLDPDQQDFYNYICYKATSMLFMKKSAETELDKTDRVYWKTRADEMNRQAEWVLAAQAPNKTNPMIPAHWMSGVP